MGIVYRETNPGPIRIIGRNVLLLRETEDSLLEDELRLRGSHSDRYTTLTVISHYRPHPMGKVYRRCRYWPRNSELHAPVIPAAVDE